MAKIEKRRAKIDLAFPAVVINTTGLKKKKNRQRWIYYRCLAVILLVLVLLVHIISRTILRLPAAGTKLDLSFVKEISDLSVEPVESWCLLGDEHDTCGCSNPLIPEARHEDARWEKVHRINKKEFERRGSEDLDVIFLGDSITEGWGERFYNIPDIRVQGALAVFQSLFSKKHGGRYEGLHQGIAGDVTPNLLWRIQNGEIGSGSVSGAASMDEADATTSSTPLIFWVLIGTNDLGNTGCSADMVLLGIVRIVEEIRKRQPSAIVVINGLLPRTTDRSGYLLRSTGKQPILWPTIQNINTELKRYADKRTRVEYFETEAFFRNSTVPNEQLRLERDLMNDFIHPSAQGYEKWGKDIVAKLDAILIPAQSPTTAPNGSK